MRRIALSNKKLRGIPRRLRALKRWSESFEGWSIDESTATSRYYDFKIPVHVHMVEGEQAQRGVRAECAQRLIDACAHLLESQRADGMSLWIVAMIFVPDMFMSRITIYTDEEYYRGQTTPGEEEFGGSTVITGRSLAREWGLVLPPGMREHGLLLNYQAEYDSPERYISEHWYYERDSGDDIGYVQ
ncbi:MAG: hypothetical protein JWQ98_3555 [Chlorobi bacterium]|nr:hypothetical protein [Chlorobiota bacterium]